MNDKKKILRFNILQPRKDGITKNSLCCIRSSPEHLHFVQRYWHKQPDLLNHLATWYILYDWYYPCIFYL